MWGRGRGGSAENEPRPRPRAPPPGPRPAPRRPSGPRPRVPSFPGLAGGPRRLRAADGRVPPARSLPRCRLPFVFLDGDELRAGAAAAGARRPALLATLPGLSALVPGGGRRLPPRGGAQLGLGKPGDASCPGAGVAAGRHGQAEQQAAARGAAGPAGEHGVHGPRAAGVVQGLPQGLPHRPPDRGGVQEDLRQLLPLRRRLQVRRARLPHLRHQRRRHHRLPGVHHRAERHLPGQAGAEAQVGLQHVRPGRQRLHQPQRDAGDRAGYLQDGVLGDEDAGGRVHSGETDGQDLQADGHQQRRQAVPGGVHQRCQERPVHRAAAAVRPQQRQPVLSPAPARRQERRPLTG